MFESFDFCLHYLFGTNHACACIKCMVFEILYTFTLPTLLYNEWTATGIYYTRNTKGGSITVSLTSCLTGLESAVWLLKIFVFICKTDWSKPVKQEVTGTVILPPLVFLVLHNKVYLMSFIKRLLSYFQEWNVNNNGSQFLTIINILNNSRTIINNS